MTTMFSRDDGFTLTELLVSTTIMLLVAGTTLTTFKNAVDINDTASQLGDTNQNLRAGTNTLVRDLMMAGRIIANGGVPVPSGGGAAAIARPGPPGSNLTFSVVADDDGTTMLPAITPGYALGAPVNPGNTTDIVTILTVDEFMPMLKGLGANTPGTFDNTMAVIAADGSSLTMLNTSPWLVGDTTNDTSPINVGDIILFKNTNGMAIQTVTSKDGTHIYFAQNDSTNDWFHLNQRNVSANTGGTGTVFCIKASDMCDTTAVPATSPVPSATVNAAWSGTPSNVGAGTALMRLLMITYYVDNTTTPGTPRLTRMINHFTPQALAGVVEDLDLTYDLVDTADPTAAPVQGLTTLPQTIGGITYTANMIKKVNIHLGVRSEQLSKPTLSYVRNHITTAVGVRSLASTDRYDTSNSPGS
ncbi:MAG TPA: prepilin-type N-terminal cleavage/methylation domain-containing protein [Vicinamibacterales bacterium]|nr:prepilin-type N-terminal cleavage/methylation domain-containing protein [Vicinamibacterales bacterium]